MYAEHKVFCEHCRKSTVAAWVKQVAYNGALQVYEYCLSCRRPSRNPKKFITHKALQERFGLDVAYLETVNPPEWSEADRPVCERCGSVNAELHHWAPRHQFADAEEWPQSYLCIRCHQKWHQVMTPNMSKPKIEKGLPAYLRQKTVQVTLVSTGDRARDTLRTRRIHGMASNYPGGDLFKMQIVENEKSVSVDFPGLYIDACDELVDRLRFLVGTSNVAIMR